MPIKLCKYEQCQNKFESAHNSSRRYCDQHIGGYSRSTRANQTDNPTNYQQLFDQFGQRLQPLPPVPNHVLATRREEMGFDTPQEAVALFSDLHWGSRIDPRVTAGLAKYDLDIARERLTRWRDVLLRFTQMDQYLVDIDTLHLFALGDDLEGHGQMFGSQKLEMTDSVGFALFSLLDHLPNVLLALLNRYKKVKVYKVRGNHGRITAQARDDYPPDNLELMLWSNIADRVRRETGGTWSETQSGIRVLEGGKIDFYISPAFMMFVDILGYTFAIRHGDRVGGVTRTYTGLVDNKLRLNAIVGSNINYYMIAHHHEAQNIENEIGGEAIVNGCQPPGEIVLCGESIQSIEQLHKADTVIDLEGKRTRIKEITARPYTGDLISVTPAKLPTLRITGDHPIYARRTGKPALWTFARDLTNEHFVWSPTPKVELEPLADWMFSPFLLGLWLAEGSCRTQYQAGFSLHRRETHLAAAIKAEIPRTRIYPVKQNSLEVIVNGAGFVHHVSAFGRLAANKHMTVNIMRQRPAYLWEVLRGWLAGDGHYKKAKDGEFYIGATVSEQLAWQMWEAARRCGLTPSLKTRPARPGHRKTWLLTFYGKEARSLIGNQRSKMQHRRLRGMWLPIARLDSEIYTGPVHNLKADGSYIASGIAVSNCFVGPSLLSVTMSRPAANIPSQEFFLFHPRHGLTHRHRIRLASAEEMRELIEWTGR